MTAGRGRNPTKSLPDMGLGATRFRGGQPQVAVAAALVLIALSGCASKPAPQENAFCVLYTRLPDPSDAVHMKKRENKLAVLTNEQTWLHECGHSGTLRKGPT